MCALAVYPTYPVSAVGSRHRRPELVFVGFAIMRSQPADLFQLPTVHLPHDDARSPLIAPLQPADTKRLSSLLLSLRQKLLLSPLADGELLTLIEEASEALSSVDQEAALRAAASPCEIDGAPMSRDAMQDTVASKRLALGDAAGDETLTPTMLVPLLRRASVLKDAALSERYLDSVGALTARLAGHGEHTLRVGLAADLPPLQLRYQPLGLRTGLRLWPCARLAIGACAARWAGLRVQGRTVLELGCGCGAVGLACAASVDAEACSPPSAAAPYHGRPRSPWRCVRTAPLPGPAEGAGLACVPRRRPEHTHTHTRARARTEHPGRLWRRSDYDVWTAPLLHSFRARRRRRSASACRNRAPLACVALFVARGCLSSA